VNLGTDGLLIFSDYATPDCDIHRLFGSCQSNDGAGGMDCFSAKDYPVCGLRESIPLTCSHGSTPDLNTQAEATFLFTRGLPPSLCSPNTGA